MTNKIPVVGKRYLKKNSDNSVWYCRSQYYRHTPDLEIWYIMKKVTSSIQHEIYCQTDENNFFILFEELPEDNLQGIEEIKSKLNN